MPRAYALIGEYLEISDVKTFEDMAIENPSHEVTSPKVDAKKLKKQQELEEKFGVNLTNKQWFKCSIEEVKYSTSLTNPLEISIMHM
jgi:hypothetical protein